MTFRMTFGIIFRETWIETSKYMKVYGKGDLKGGSKGDFMWDFGGGLVIFFTLL